MPLQLPSSKLCLALLAAAALSAFTVPAHAELNCDGWNTGDFFEVATEPDVDRCLNAGADPNVGTETNFTPLHFAAAQGTAETVNALLNAGSNINARTEHGFSPLHRAARWGTTETVNALLDAGANLNVKDRYGNTPFDYATLNEKLENTDAYMRLSEVQ